MITRLSPRPSRALLSSCLTRPCAGGSFNPSITPFRHTRQPFTHTTVRTDDSAGAVNHYEVLKLPPNCTPSELKKQFYRLSKETHPDRNPDDPTASQRFSQLSESYSILANPEKRKRYDRDVLRQQQASSRRGGGGGGGGSFVGSRPASGLSKRRGTFRGPPPSFYAHGNPSARNAKQAGGVGGGGGASNPQQAYGQGQAGSFDANAYAGSGPDFDPTSTFRTQTVEDSRRNARRAAAAQAAQDELDSDNDFWVRFVVVSGVILLTVTIGTVVASSGSPKGGLIKGDGTRRDKSAS